MFGDVNIKDPKMVRTVELEARGYLGDPGRAVQFRRVGSLVSVFDGASDNLLFEAPVNSLVSLVELLTDESFH